MGHTELVPASSPSVNITTGAVTSEPHPVDTAARPGTGTSALEEAPPDGLPLVRQALQEKGLSSRTSDILMLSWRERTRKQYRTYINKWITFANSRELDPLHPTLGQCLNFLTMLYDSGLKYSALNTARCALSSFVQMDSDVSLGSNPLVKRFLKAVFQTRSSLPKYQHVWNVDSVLTLSPK